MTTFNRILAVSDGPPKSPGATDGIVLSLTAFRIEDEHDEYLIDVSTSAIVLGNATNNPSFEFAGEGTVTVGGDLSVTGDVTGAVGSFDSLAVTGSMSVGGDLVVSGSVVSKDTETVLVSDNFLDLNYNYTTVSGQAAGFTFNYLPIESKTVTGMVGASRTITVASAFASIAANDFVVVSGLLAQNVGEEGIYEVESVSGPDVVIKASPVLSFCRGSFSNVASPGGSAKLARVNLSVVRVSTAGDLQFSKGAASGMTFGDVPFNGYSGAQAWTQGATGTAGLTLNGVTSASTPTLLVNDDEDASVFEVNLASVKTTVTLLLAELGADPAEVANWGNVYVKDVSGYAELFYRGDDGTGAVQITNQGALNSGASATMQIAYDNGATIATDATGPLAITVNETAGAEADGQGLSVAAGTGALDGIVISGTFGGSGLVVGDGGKVAFNDNTDTFAVDVQSPTDVTYEMTAAALTIVGATSIAGSVYLSKTGGDIDVTAMPGDIHPDLAVAGKVLFGAHGGTDMDLDFAVLGSSAFLAQAGSITAPDFSISGWAHIKNLRVTSEDGDNTTPDFSVPGYAKFDGGFAVDANSGSPVNIGANAAALTISTTTSGAIVLSSAAGIKLQGTHVTTNHTTNSSGAGVGANLCVSVNGDGNFAAVSAGAVNSLVLGVTVEAVSASTASTGKVAEFGKVTLSLQSGIEPGVNELLYLSASDAGKVTNVAPSAANTTVYLVGKSLEAASGAGGTIVAALHRQFLYNN